MRQEKTNSKLMGLMAEHSPHGLVFIEKDGRWIDINPAFTVITGYTLEDIPDSETWFEKAFPNREERERVKNLWKEDFKNALNLDREVKIVCKDGQKKWVSMKASVLPEGQVVLSLHDITPRKILENEKEEAEQFYQALLEIIPDMVVVSDEHGIITYASDAAAKFLGYDRVEEIVGKNNLEFFPEEVKETIFQVGELVQKMGTISPFVTSIIRKDGERKSIEMSIARIFPRGDIPGAYIAIFRDMTDRLHLEQRLRQMVEEKEVLIREIHHRVKNNLQLIVSLLRLQFYQSPDPQVQSALKDAINRVRSIALIYEGLLRTENIDRINLKNYTEKIVSHVLNLFKEKSEKVQVCLELEDIEVDIAKAHPCGLILSELLSNVFKHAFPEGIGNLAISLKKNDDRMITLTVADNGTGLPPDFPSKMPGSLGWQIVHDLVNQLSGEIEVKAEKGTEIRISFPAWSSLSEDWK